MSKERYPTGTKWEPIVGYSRAVRAGSVIHVSGITATDESGNFVGKDDPGAQAERIFMNIDAAMKELGFSLKDVVRTRM